MDDGLKAWLGPAYAELTEAQRERVAAKARDLNRTMPGPDHEDQRQDALNLYVQWLLGDDEKPQIHRYLISYGIIVNDMPGSGSFTVRLDHKLNEADIMTLMADVQRQAQTIDPDASMPNVTSVWKFED